MCEGEHMSRSEVKEGKIELRAECDGLLKVNDAGMRSVNGFGQMMIASRHGNFPVKKGDKLCGTRIIPLVIEEEKMERAREACLAATGGRPILELLPFVHKKVGIVTTGNEVFYGRIEDTFTPVLVEKFAEYEKELSNYNSLVPSSLRSKEGMNKIKILLMSNKAGTFEEAVELLNRH